MPANIRAGMAANERWVLAVIREEGAYRPYTPGRSVRNAVERLEQKGTIRYDHREAGYVLAKRRRP